MINQKHFTHPFFFFITLLFTSTSLITSPVHSKCTKKERQALLHFKSCIHYDPQGLLSTWTTGEEGTTSDCCYWDGISCNNQSHVTDLDLRGGYLEGKISPSLLNLSYLNYLDLSLNSFNGMIPMVIGSMTQLRYLDLGWNDFSGTIPMFIGSMTQLRYLGLGGNYFSGTIPSEFGNLTNLQVLSLEHLSNCTIENLDWLSHLSQLEELVLSGTSLSKVNNWVNVILSLKKLSALYLHGCDLSQVMHPYSYSFVNSSFSSSIVTLSLEENNLNSSMYHWLFPLTSNALEELYLSGNKLDVVPKYFGNLCGLTSLNFYGNSMPINLPDFLRNLSGCTSVTLQNLDASFSYFTGSLSDDIQNFSSLKSLSLSNNQLNGTISEKVWQLPNLQSLEYIGLSSCNLGPRFPKWIQTMKNLSSIDLANTGVLDNIPEDFWKTWPSRLRYLNISFNNITGRVTNMLSNFDPNSSIIDLSSNNFYGHIPSVPSSLERLDLSKNNLSGQIVFLCQIVHGSLYFLDLSHNAFTGPIPDCLWHFTELEVLSLGYNNLSGRLPVSFKFLINLEVLYLYNNNFSGKLPLSFMNFTRLTFLNLGANKFSGYVPDWIGERLLWLYALILTSNKFIGTIPSNLCQIVYLQILDLSMNKLEGAIPSCLGELTFMVQDRPTVKQNVHMFFNVSGGAYVDHSMIKWQGCLREFGSTLDLVKIINLSSNNLTGKIPDKLTDLHNLIELDLSMNALVGEIPSKIGQMKELQILDLSRNNLRGGLPSSMSQMTFLNYLNVSYNNLSGRIPSSTQLQSFEPSRYTGNAGLCGLPLSKYCPGDIELGPPITHENMDDKEGTNDLQKWFYIGGATGFITGFWTVCIALLVNRRGRHAFFHFMNSLEDWVYVNMMVFTAKLRRVSHP